MHGEGKNLPRRPLRDREGSFRYSRIRESLLQMQGNGIVNCVRDFLIGKVFRHRIATAYSQSVLMIDVPAPGDLVGDNSAAPGKQPVIRMRRAATRFMPPFKILQLHLENSRLERIEPTVNAENFVVVLLPGSMHDDHSRLFSKEGVVRHNHSGIAEGSQVLAREETDGTKGSDTPHFASLVFRPHGLCSILDNGDSVLVRDRHDLVHGTRLPVQMNGDNGPGLLCDGRFNSGRIDIIGGRIDLHVHGLRADQSNGFGRRHERKGSCDDFIPVADSQRHHRNLQRVGPGSTTDRILDMKVRGNGGFKLADLLPHDIVTGIEHPMNSLVDLRFDFLVLGYQVNHLYVHRICCLCLMSK